MRRIFLESRGSFSFIFEQDNHEMNSLDLANFLQNMNELVVCVSKHKYIDSVPQLSVTALNPGSFDVGFTLLTAIGKTLLDGLPVVHSVISIVLQSFKLKKHLAGKSPKEVISTETGKTIVTNSYGDNFIFDGDINFYFNDPTIAKKITDISMKATQGYKITTKNEAFICSKDDLPIMQSYSAQEVECKRYINRAILEIRQPDLLGSSQWGFRLAEHSMRAKIVDEKWLQQIHKRQILIGSGDKMECELETLVDLNSARQPLWDTAKYTVLKVSRIFTDNTKPSPIQEQFTFRKYI